MSESRFLVLCDLDGVVWLAQHPIPGSIDAIARLRGAGHRLLFVTNNSAPTLAESEATLERIGIPARGDVLTSSMAAALMIAPAERVMVCGGPGIVEAVTGRGARVVDEAPFDAVMVGFHRNFDYETMRRSSAAVRGGARLIATNDDATYPTPDGPIPGGGSILAGIATASLKHAAHFKRHSQAGMMMVTVTALRPEWTITCPSVAARAAAMVRGNRVDMHRNSARS